MTQDRSRSANPLLAALSETEYECLESHLTPVSLPRGKIFYEALEKIEYVYFPNTSLISLVNILEDGSSTEISLIGGTGMVGLPVILDSGLSQQRAIVQIPDSALKISAVVSKIVLNIALYGYIIPHVSLSPSLPVP